jgi:hypothetical protein
MTESNTILRCGGRGQRGAEERIRVGDAIAMRKGPFSGTVAYRDRGEGQRLEISWGEAAPVAAETMHVTVAVVPPDVKAVAASSKSARPRMLCSVTPRVEGADGLPNRQNRTSAPRRTLSGGRSRPGAWEGRGVRSPSASTTQLRWIEPDRGLVTSRSCRFPHRCRTRRPGAYRRGMQHCADASGSGIRSVPGLIVRRGQGGMRGPTSPLVPDGT